MKTTTFDQLKSMLKSMSLSIFPRLRNMEKNIDEIKATIPAPEKEIIFTKGADGQYTCNIPHAELWEMDADIIGKNACIIDGDEVYGARGATKKTETLYGNVIQVYADLNVGKYDIPSTYHQTLIITYCTPEILGKASTIFGEKVYSLSDARNNNATPDIPVLDGGGWMNRSIDFMEYDALNGAYTLKNMSETTKGGAMVGEGLKMVGDALTVDEGVYELIETITLTANSAITRTQEPDGTPYKLKKVMVKTQFSTTGAYSAGGAYAYFKCKNTNIGYMWYGDLNINTAATRYHVDIAKIENAKWLIEWQDWTAVATMQFKSAFKDINTYDAKTYDAIDTIQINQILPAGTIIEIWGVKADA